MTLVLGKRSFVDLTAEEPQVAPAPVSAATAPESKPKQKRRKKVPGPQLSSREPMCPCMIPFCKHIWDMNENKWQFMSDKSFDGLHAANCHHNPHHPFHGHLRIQQIPAQMMAQPFGVFDPIMQQAPTSMMAQPFGAFNPVVQHDPTFMMSQPFGAFDMGGFNMGIPNMGSANLGCPDMGNYNMFDPSMFDPNMVDPNTVDPNIWNFNTGNFDPAQINFGHITNTGFNVGTNVNVPAPNAANHLVGPVTFDTMPVPLQDLSMNNVAGVYFDPPLESAVPELSDGSLSTSPTVVSGSPPLPVPAVNTNVLHQIVVDGDVSALVSDIEMPSSPPQAVEVASIAPTIPAAAITEPRQYVSLSEVMLSVPESNLNELSGEVAVQADQVQKDKSGVNFDDMAFDALSKWISEENSRACD